MIPSLARRSWIVLTLSLFLAACSASTLEPAPTPAPPSESPTATLPPTPMAVLVNGEGIPVEEFEAELARYQAAHPQAGLDQATSAVIDYFVNELLLAQGARAAGYSLSDEALEARIASLEAQIGGAEALAAWQAAHGYTPETFRQALRRQIEAAWMRDQIAASVPATAEQVHVQQILLYNEEDARAVLAQLQAGADFYQLAAAYDPLTRGDLGWFPRGYLPEPAFEAAAFSLQPGQVSDILQTEAGYHIIMVVERDANHPLSSDALLSLQYRAVDEWLASQRQQSTIILAP
ncbi:MAG: peptidylprolyl isomerase [Anaerolineales bacterium]